MKGVKGGQPMLIAGKQQYHEDDIAINFETEEKIGIGIYCSPHF